MGHKVDISEVIEFANELKTVSNDIKTNLDQVITSIDQVKSMDTFSGEAANNAKTYFEDFHKISAIDVFKELFTDLTDHLNSHLESFKSNVDAGGSAIIQSDYLSDGATQIDINYQKISSVNDNVQRAIDTILDISSVSSPVFYSVTGDKRDVTEKITKTEENVSSFTSEGNYQDSQTKALMQRIEQTLNKVKSTNGEDRFTDHNVSVATEKLKDAAAVSAAGVVGTVASIEIARAAKNKGLSVSKYVKNGKTTYRINASEAALKELGVEPDKHAQYALKQSTKSGAARAPLNYYDKKTGRQVWSKTGQRVIKSNPPMQAYNDKASNKMKFKSVGKATVSATKNSVTADLNPKNVSEDLNSKNINGVAKGVGKGLGVAGVGLNYYANYNDAKVDGLTGEEAHTRAAVDTTIDTAIGGAVQAGFTAAGTAFIPIPGVGTAIGAAAGIFANMALNTGVGKSNKSVMDRAKDAFHNLTSWFS
ncbi:T7SS effector LXG polymorphic toxin [Lentibacillus jeotgali]|uniref:T7SS effector LXG polymorphic toxin n=1 Tax=Lentibacillus jeotgali TaxID=558169 RepID=UPI0002627482|nr:T7SS effector LXG polymorphic toxin [Lentibacillus jeotgali]